MTTVATTKSHGTEALPILPTYSTVACIGAGLGAIALGAQLKRWYGFEDIQFFERHPTSGGTWWVNSYPGCACDVPSALYSFSFEQNPNWTKLMPSNDEIREYAQGVAAKYDLPKKMTFNVDVERCDWREDASRWLLEIRDKKTGELFFHECQILFSATGALVQPREIDIPGSENFAGAIFHSARWDHSVSLKGKNVIVIGNGCTAAQIVPAIVDEVKTVTQLIRTKHWIFESPKPTYTPFAKWCFRNVPGAMQLHRFAIFATAESDLSLFYMTKSGARARERRRIQAEKYMKETAPAKYHDLLIPDFDVGCKRRIFDCGYLESLHSKNFNLTDAKPLEIVPEGIRTANGIIKADVIVLANGFKTNEYLHPLQVYGRDGISVSEHWASNYGGPSAYNCSAMNGFPNFFMILGPNAATGHTSALMAGENTINYALRILEPVLRGETANVEVKLEAEKKYVFHMQDELKKRVWSAGCVSWYIKGSNKWNSMAYPWSQAHFWFRSLFPTYSDWIKKPIPKAVRRHASPLYLVTFIICLVAPLGVAYKTNPFSLSLLQTELISRFGALRSFWS